MKSVLPFVPFAPFAPFLAQRSRTDRTTRFELMPRGFSHHAPKGAAPLFAPATAGSLGPRFPLQLGVAGLSAPSRRGVSEDELEAFIQTPLRMGESLLLTAVAGCGKSTALRLYAQRFFAVHGGRRGLYVCFGKAAQEDQQSKFNAAGLAAVDVKTLDALSYEATEWLHGGSVASMLHVLPSHVSMKSDACVRCVVRTLAAFVATESRSLEAWHVAQPLPPSVDGAAWTVGAVLALARGVWRRLCTPGVLPQPTHAVLTKVFLLSHAAAEVRYDLVLVDEAHDLTAAEFAAVNLIRGRRIYAHDGHQSIFGFRGCMAPESMAAAPFVHRRALTQSHRCGKPLASDVRCIVSGLTGDAEFEFRGAAGRTTTISTEAEPPVRAAREAGVRLAVVGACNLDLLRCAGRILDASPDTRLFFLSGAPFAFVHKVHGRAAVLAAAALLRGEAVATRPLSHFGSGERAWSRFHAWARDAAVDTHEVSWRSAAAVALSFPGAALQRLLEALEGRVADVDAADVTLTTAHAAKGLTWDWVALLDSLLHTPRERTDERLPQLAARLGVSAAAPGHVLLAGCGADAAAAREVADVFYVAATRASGRLSVTPRLAEWVEACRRSGAGDVYLSRGPVLVD